jgi:josephin
MTAEIADIENQQIRQIYHEKQRKQLCLLHTLNNLFQRREFEQQELDAICEKFV